MIDNVGNRTISDCRRALTPTGTYVMDSLTDTQTPSMPTTGRSSRRWVDRGLTEQGSRPFRVAVGLGC